MSEKENQQKHEKITEEQKSESWIKIFGIWLTKDFKNIQKRLESRLNKATKKTESALSKFNEAFKERVDVQNLKENPHQALSELEKVSDEMSKLEKEMKKLEGNFDIPIIDKKIKKLKNLKSQLEKKQIEVSENQAITNELEIIKKREASLYLRELYKNDHKEIAKYSSEILGMKMELIEKLAYKDKNSDLSNAEFELLSSYHNRLTKLRKNYDLGERNILTNETISQSELKQRIEKEQKRARRSAEIKVLKQKLENISENNNYISPKEQIRYLELLKASFKDIREADLDSEFDEERAIAELREDTKDKSSINIDKEIENLEIQIKKHKEDLNESLNSISNIEDRRNIIKEKALELNNSISEGTKILESNTNYESQIKYRLDMLDNENKGNEIAEFIDGIESMTNSYIEEYENIRRIERNGPIKLRGERAKQFAKRRIMQEFGDVEKVRALYGDKYAKYFEESSSEIFEENLLNEKASEILSEISEKFNFGKNGILEPEDNIDKSKKSKLDKEAGEIFSSIEKQITEIMNNKKIGHEISKAFEDESDRKILSNSIKEDLKFNRFLSEFKNLNIDKLDEKNLYSIYEMVNSNNPEKLFYSIKNQGIDISLEDVKSKIDSLNLSYKVIDNIFEKDQDTLDYKYEVVSTPNGIALAFDKASELDIALLGKSNNILDYPETIAATLKKSDNFDEAIKSILPNREWNGSIIVIGSEGGEHDLVHETQHAILRSLKNETNAEKNEKLNSAVEEMAIKIGTGEIWDELLLEPGAQSNERISLAALGYVLPGEFDEEDAKKLYKILEYSKRIIGVEQGIYRTSSEEFLGQNVFGPIIADIITSHIDDNGKIDLYAAIKNIEKSFDDYDKYNFNLKELGEKLDSENLTESMYFGFPNNTEVTQEIKNRFLRYSNNPGFDFAVVQTSDTRGRANINYDHHFGKKAGIHVAEEVGIVPAIELPFPLSILGNALYKKAGKKVNPGPVEYHIAEGMGSFPIFGNFLNYKTHGRAWGGVVRKIQSKLPWPLKDMSEAIVPEYQTKFGSNPAKMFNDLPPFGRGWEQIVKDLAPGLVYLGKQKFPGRSKALETMTPNARELWDNEIKTLFGNLGADGIGLSPEEAQRVLGEMPGIVYEIDGGRLKFEQSNHHLDTIDVDGKHCGRIKEDFLSEVGDTRFRKNDKYDETKKPRGFGADREAWEDSKKSAQKNFKINNETVELAQHMHDVYDKDHYSYTVNDLITASHLAHDLGINTLTGVVRNDYYQKDMNKEGFVRKGENMVGEHMWYNINNPSKRGIVIGHGDNQKLFSLDAAHELLRRYKIFYIERALRDGLPEITSLMQKNLYEPDLNQNEEGEYTGRIVENIEGIPTVLTLDLIRNRDFQEKFPEVVMKYIAGQNAYGELMLKDDFAWYFDEELDDHVVHEAAKIHGTNQKIKNNFYNSTPYTVEIPKIEKSEFLRKSWMSKTEYDLGSLDGAYKEQFGYLQDYMQKFAEISMYERKAYYSKTFWGDTKEWLQKIGKTVMIGAAIGAALTGAGAFGSIFLGTLALQAVGVNFMQHRFKVMSQRRLISLELLQKFANQQSMYQPIIEGKGLSRLQRKIMRVFQSDNEAKMEDLAKEKIPKGSYPGDDWAHKIISSVFGTQGLIMQSVSS